MGYVKAFAGALMNFQLATGIDPCIAFAGFCAVIAGVLSLKVQPRRKAYKNLSNPFGEGEQPTRFEELWNEKISPILLAVGLIALGTFTLLLAAVSPNFNNGTNRSDNSQMESQH